MKIMKKGKLQVLWEKKASRYKIYFMISGIGVIILSIQTSELQLQRVYLYNPFIEFKSKIFKVIDNNVQELRKDQSNPYFTAAICSVN